MLLISFITMLSRLSTRLSLTRTMPVIHITAVRTMNGQILITQAAACAASAQRLKTVAHTLPIPTTQATTSFLEVRPQSYADSSPQLTDYDFPTAGQVHSCLPCSIVFSIILSFSLYLLNLPFFQQFPYR